MRTLISHYILVDSDKLVIRSQDNNMSWNDGIGGTERPLTARMSSLLT